MNDYDGEEQNPNAYIMGFITAPTGTLVDEEFINDAFIHKKCYSPDRKDQLFKNYRRERLDG